MNIHPYAEALLEGDRYRFTIREIGVGDLRKHMTAARFMRNRQDYFGRNSVRVDVLDTENGVTQTWDIYLCKWFCG